jgi:CheY-like chemotaxis protein
MKKRILSIGQCGPDNYSIRAFLTRSFDCDIDTADATADALAQMKRSKFDLVLVNRKLDADYSDGIEVIRALKDDPATASVPVMLITNYPEHQDAAIDIGAIRGFGKLEFGKRETLELLTPILGEA